ncbi:thiomuracin/GE37468 family thiazolyl RiPP peptide [Streptomyces sp. NPDC127074]|uniref:thiomuracin/GE37468 family thiazolyl RiPP peptide n=1 Tax=Streptomyces sp. NPDC127074 TaxID=3347130 RepID=UPI0036462DF8
MDSDIGADIRRLREEFEPEAPTLAEVLGDLSALSLDLDALTAGAQGESLTAGHGMTEASASYCCAPPPNCCNCGCS